VKPASAAPSTVTARTTKLSVLGGDDGGASGLTYTWSALSGPAGAPLPTYSINGNNAAQNTQVTFYKAGTYVLQATIEDATGKMVSSNVTVTVQQTLTSIAITPSNPNVADGGTQQFQATARDQFGAAMSKQPSWTWKLTSGVGTLSSSGLFTAPSSGTGTATVQASSGALTGSTSLNVGPTPVAPSNLSAAVISSNQVNLSWRDNSSNETGFILQRSTNAGSWTSIAKVGANVTTFSDKTVSTGTTYSYRVSAYNSFGSSAFSSTAGNITPGATGGITTAAQPQVARDGEPSRSAASGGVFGAQRDNPASLGSSFVELDFISDESFLTALAMTRFLAEPSRVETPMMQDAIWLAWRDELVQNAFNREQLPLLESLWPAWR
jgi:hypothetical protein